MKNKKKVMAIIVGVISVIAILVIGLTFFIGSQIINDNSSVESSDTNEFIESAEPDIPEYEDVANNNVNNEITESVESEEIVEEEPDTSYQGQRAALTDEELAEKDKQLQEYVKSQIRTDVEPSEPYPALVDELSKPINDVKWENVYLTQSYLLWWLMEKAPDIVPDIHYVISYDLDNLEITVGVDGDETAQNKVKENLNPWFTKILEHSAYAEIGESFNILYQES